MSAAGDRHIDKVAQLPCVVCLYKLDVIQEEGEVHHVSVPANNFAVAKLCVEHHRGPTGVHGLHRRGFERMWKLDEIGLLALTNRAIAEGR
ncbi:MAG TPA: hypothetical protein VIQ51_17595 [Chryseosolibacter sp.]|jgi:hypothetical protein